MQHCIQVSFWFSVIIFLSFDIVIRFHTMPANKSQIVKVTDESQVIAKLWQLIEQAAKDAIKESGVFRIGLSGGSLVRYMATGAQSSKTDWSKWKLFFCDERFVKFDDADSTFGQYRNEFIPKTSLKEDQFVTIDTTLELKDCAQAYEQEIYKNFGIQDVRFGWHFDCPRHLYFNFLIFSWISKRYRNLICCCWEWVLMDILAHYFRIIHCFKLKMC